MARRKRAVAEVAPVEEEAEVIGVINVPIDDIVPYEDNPRINNDAVETIINSIREFRFVAPILLDRFGVIVAGHTRYAAAKAIGMTHIPSIYAEHLSEDQAKAFRIVDNKTSEKSFWDEELLRPQIEELQDMFEFTEYGFEQTELDELLGAEFEEDSTSTVEDEVEPRNSARSPNRIKFTVGEFVFHVEQDVYRLWSNQVRTECDFSEDDIIRHLKTLLGLSQYEEVND